MKVCTCKPEAILFDTRPHERNCPCYVAMIEIRPNVEPAWSVVVHYDGTVEYTGAASIDEAARLLWEAFAGHIQKVADIPEPPKED